MGDLDFEGLGRTLLSRARDLLPAWQPGGRLVGSEWTCASVNGGQGDSCKTNVNTGRGADFASGDKWGDLVSLYSKIQGLSQGDAFKALAADFSPSLSTPSVNSHLPPPAEPARPQKPPANAPDPQWGSSHVAHWPYRDAAGELLFYVSRHAEPGGGKLFVPFTWNGKSWVRRSWPSPRPLYGLELLSQAPDRPVLVVEGEKAADAARRLVGEKYVVVSWPNGARAVSKADWTVLAGRKLLIWPDADGPGHEAAQEVARTHVGANPGANVKILETDGQVEGWDAADALAEGWDWDRLVEWAKPRAKAFTLDQPQPAKTKKPDVVATATASGFVSRDSLGLATAGGGRPVYNVDNCLRVFEKLPHLTNGGAFVWFDEFYNRFYTKLGGPLREWGDVETLNLLAFFQRELGLHKVSDSMIWQAVQIFAHRNTKNAPMDWFKTLAWDRVDRLDRFCVDHLGVVPSPETPEAYLQAAGRNFWVSMVARAAQPGCKVHHMLVLEGKQDRYKSTALETIGGDWYLDCRTDISDHERFSEVIQGKLLIEISELDSFRKAGLNTVKAMLTAASDRFRPAYARVSKDFPRRCVFAGTTNEHNYLMDEENRRFWPMSVGRIDLPRLKADRDQLFAEAACRLEAGEGWWLMPSVETKAAQASRRMSDEWEDVIRQHLVGAEETTVRSIAETALEYSTKAIDSQVSRRISRVLRVLGWEQDVVRDGDGTRRVWRPQTPF